jgi:hypothetical protein
MAEEVADTKSTADLWPLFKLSKAVAEKQPKTLITDGAPNFHEAYKKEFYTRKNGTEHIQEIRMAGKVHNNKMERMNKPGQTSARTLSRNKTKSNSLSEQTETYHYHLG